jgi:small subunit ribosomal protein S2
MKRKDYMSEVSLKKLLEAGAHFGHQTRRWNPKMNRYIYGARGGVHIIDLVKTASELKKALEFVKSVTAGGKSVMFVGTKRQARPIIVEEAKFAGMPYVVERWLGGMLTNFRTIRAQVNRLKDLEQQAESGELATNYNKKEASMLSEEARKLSQVFGGIQDMDELPGALFVVDVPKERIAIAEAKKLGIPVVAMADSNADPDVIDYPIPANDDAIKAIKLVTHAVAEAAAAGKLAAEKTSKSEPETAGIKG